MHFMVSLGVQARMGMYAARAYEAAIRLSTTSVRDLARCACPAPSLRIACEG